MTPLALLFAAAPLLPVQSWLEAPGVRWVAVQSYPEHCVACKKAAPRWAALKSKYERGGLRIVSIVDRDPFEGCLDPRFKPHVVECDYYFDSIAKAWKLRAKSPTVFLWDWTGRMLVERGTVADVERALRRAPSLPLAVIAAPDDLFSTVASAMVATNKFEPADVATSRARLARPKPRAEQACEGVSLADVIVTVERKGSQLIGTLVSEDDCRLARDSAASASELVRRLMARIHRSVRMPSIEKSVDVQPGRLIAEGGTREAQDRKSRARLASFKHPTSRALAKAVEPFIGMPFAQTPSDPGIGGPPFARRVMQDALGIDIGETLLDMVAAPEVPLDLRDPERTLQPGDLLFYVSYAYIPRSVSVYLGKGLIAQSVVVRGVTVDPVPTEIPYYLYLVARRPTR